MTQKSLSQLPSVDRLLALPELAGTIARVGRTGIERQAMKRVLATACAFAFAASVASAAPEDHGRERYRKTIEKLSRAHGVPEALIHRVIMRESKYAPHLTNHGHYGLMQIKLDTAKGMGYGGGAKGLLDGETNLTYAIPYLANAWLAADHDENRAVQLYAGGYYYVAKRKGLIGKLRTAKSEPLQETALVAYAEQPQPESQQQQWFLDSRSFQRPSRDDQDAS